MRSRHLTFDRPKMARGSVAATLAGPDSAATAADASVNAVASGTAMPGGAPATSGVTTTGQSVNAPSGFPMWIIGVVIALIVLVALVIVLVVVLLRRRRSGAKEMGHYEPMRTESTYHTFAAPETITSEASSSSQLAPAALQLRVISKYAVEALAQVRLRRSLSCNHLLLSYSTASLAGGSPGPAKPSIPALIGTDFVWLFCRALRLSVFCSFLILAVLSVRTNLPLVFR